MRINKYALVGIVCGVGAAIVAKRLSIETTPKPPPRGNHDGWHRITARLTRL